MGTYIDEEEHKYFEPGLSETDTATIDRISVYDTFTAYFDRYSGYESFYALGITKVKLYTDS